MHKLFAKQVAKARRQSGDIDFDALGHLVSAAFEEADRDRRRTDRSIELMIEELDQLNRRLENLVAERTRELRQREAELQAQNLRFNAAVTNMSQGLVMFDAESRLLIRNQRYLDMYRLTPRQAQPGCTLLELLQQRAASGTFSGDPQKYVAQTLAGLAQGKLEDRIVELDDGRTISITNQMTPEGGWVATHEDITERRRSEKQIAHMARHDALTDLPNRLLLREWLAQALAHVHRGHNLAVHYLDLDHFKTVNDTLGHPIGDELLRAVAERLRGCLRETDLVARVGGDEFAIVQTGIETPADAAILARRICDAIKVPYNLHGHAAIVEASIGISLSPGDGFDPNGLMKNADMALYRAKADGRGIYRFFEPEMDARMQARRTLELALRKALPNGEFKLYYQPVIDLSANEISAVEALIRWQHPERGIIPPAEFIPVAEEIGMIVPLGEWVIRKACADAADWPANIKVAVNLSPTQLSSPGVTAVVVDALAAARLPPQRLEVEITEAVLMQNSEVTLATLHRLREIGVRIALDDFGTGYSSLSYLRSFPFDKLKIDRCFVKGLEDGEESVAIVRAVTSLATNLKMTTTAEGVENEEQLDHVRRLGCTEMQGFLFSGPVPAGQIASLFCTPKPLRRGAA